MATRTIGAGPQARQVFPVGLGAMPLSLRAGLTRAEAVRVVHAALDAGVTLIDTADAYAPLDGDDVGHNERIVAEALRTWPGSGGGGSGSDRPHGPVVATKGGHTRTADGSWEVDGSPDHLRRACDASLRALGLERIDLYQLHRVDPAVGFADSVGALRDLRDAGKVALVGLSNVSVAQIEEARSILGPAGVASVQNRWSPAHREHAPELLHCAREGIAFLPWSPLGGMWGAAGRVGEEHAAFATVAAELGVTPQQVVIAWHLALADVVVPIPGASRPGSIVASAAAAAITLDEDQMALLGRP